MLPSAFVKTCWVSSSGKFTSSSQTVTATFSSRGSWDTGTNRRSGVPGTQGVTLRFSFTHASAGTRHHEVFAEGLLDKDHVLGRGEPGVVEYITKDQAIADTDAKHLPIEVIFALARLPLGTTRFLVGAPVGLLDQLEGDGQGDALTVIEGCQQIEPFDAAPHGVVPMPADQLALIGVGLGFDAVVNHQNRLFLLYRTHQGLDQKSQVGRSEILL